MKNDFVNLKNKGAESFSGENLSKAGHISVMKDEVLEFLALRYPGKFLDMTFGGGGHTRAILEGHEGNTVVAVDCDPEAAPRAEILKKEFGERFKFVDAFFDEVSTHKEIVEEKFDGILFDLGVSSFQLDTMERGFSFRAEAQADMRMNPRVGVPAWKYIEEANEEMLTTVARDWAEEPRWRLLVAALEKAKGTQEIRTTLGLSEIISKYTRRPGYSKIHPATRVFMALRMAVNDEIGRLERALPMSFALLEKGGVLAVISFHSVEDRVAKEFFKTVTRPKNEAEAKLLLKKVSKPTWAERKENNRARSAKLRVLQKN